MADWFGNKDEKRPVREIAKATKAAQPKVEKQAQTGKHDHDSGINPNPDPNSYTPRHGKKDGK